MALLAVILPLVKAGYAVKLAAFAPEDRIELRRESPVNNKSAPPLPQQDGAFDTGEHDPEQMQAEPATSASQFNWQYFLILAVFLVVCGAIAFCFDHPISSQLAEPPHEFSWLGGDLKKLVALCETFGHGTGVALIILAVIALDPKNRWNAGILIATAFGAGMMANLAKISFVARMRPYRFDFSQGIEESFVQWFPFLDWFSQAELRESALQSFPSGHSATAAGLCVGLCYLYPHGRWYFLLLASLACFQRVAFRAHFPSDVCFGAALGLITATLLIKYGRIAEGTAWLKGRFGRDIQFEERSDLPS